MGVYSRPDSPYFWMAIEQAQGPPLRESTGIPCRGLSPEQARENRKLANRLYLSRTTTDAAAALGLVDDRETIRFAAYAAWYEKHKIQQSRDDGEDRDLRSLDHLKACFAGKWLHEIDRAATTEYMTARTAAKAMPRTVNREVDLLKSMLRDAVPKYLKVSPLVGMKRLRVVAPRRHYTTEQEEDRIVRVLVAERDYAGLALYYLATDSLVRLGDLLDFRRDDDRGRAGWVPDPKDPRQSTPYTFPISKRARKALDKIPDDGPHYFARFRVAKNPRNWRGSVRQWLERVCATAGVKFGRKAGGMTWHWGTRRTGASRMLRRKVDIGTVQDVGHWKNPEIVLEIYREGFSEEAARAVEIPGRRPRRFTSRSRGAETRENIQQKRQ